MFNILLAHDVHIFKVIEFVSVGGQACNELNQTWMESGNLMAYCHSFVLPLYESVCYISAFKFIRDCHIVL